jgi:4-amino-4-deoxy-L-arabinose transferase-like glycosyltransferase
MPSAPEQPRASDTFRDALSENGAPTPREVFAILACYFAIQVVLRVTFSTSVDLDESEAAVLTQKFSWGYGSNPPLYAWLQMPFFLFGPSVLALSVLKNLLLLSTYLLSFATARLVTRSNAAAVAATLSLLYLPSVAWESQRDLTHTVLSATLSVGTLFCFLRLHETRRLLWYIIFGICAGCGVLSKYNYALWLLGLGLAALSTKDLRTALLDRRMLLSVGIATLITLPNILWMLHNRDLALLNSSKFGAQQSITWYGAGRIGFKNVAQSILSFAAPLAGLYLAIFFKAPIRAERSPATGLVYRSLILRTWLIVAGVLALLIVFGHATGFKERWFQPILVVLPIAAVSLVQQRLSTVRLKCIASVSVIVMLAVAMIMPGRLLAAEHLKREEPLTRPYAQLAGELRPTVPAGSLVICNTLLLAGNMRLGLRDATAISPELWPIFRDHHPHCFLVWDARRDDSPPPELRRWAEANGVATAAKTTPHFLLGVYRYHRSKEFRLGFVQLY